MYFCFVWLLKTFITYRVCVLLCHLWRIFILWFMYPMLNWLLDLKPYVSEWVVVTGATDGIGRLYTLELAKRGLRKFFLIGRNEQKLSRIADTLAEQYDCQVETYVTDFSNPCFEVPDLGNYTVGILINCAGMFVKRFEHYVQQPKGTAVEIVNVNIYPVVKMCDIVYPQMIERNKGIIVNFSSVADRTPIPLLSTYPAAKSFVTDFSECLYRESRSTNVIVQCLTPVIVATKMRHYANSNLADGYLVVKPEIYAKQAVDIIGMDHYTTGCLVMDIQVAAMAYFPSWLTNIVLIPLIDQQRREFNQMEENRRNNI